MVLQHAPQAATGLSEFEAWGAHPENRSAWIRQRPPSLAANPTGTGFPRAAASYTSRFDRVAFANDGVINYRASPHNRWTAYESPNQTDWLEVDFGAPQTIGRIELHIYDDRGGVQPPSSYQVQYQQNDQWKNVTHMKTSPETPRGGMMNTVTFDPVMSRRVRVVFNHAGQSRSGITEIEVWEK